MNIFILHIWQLNSTKIVEGFSTFLFVAGGSHASHGERLSSAHFQTPFQGGFNVLRYWLNV